MSGRSRALSMRARRPMRSVGCRTCRYARRPSSDIFTSHTIHPHWAFHYGGRTELQFNIGLEEGRAGH